MPKINIYIVMYIISMISSNITLNPNILYMEQVQQLVTIYLILTVLY